MTTNRYEVAESQPCSCTLIETRGHIHEQGRYASEATLSQHWMTSPDCHSHGALDDCISYDADLDPPGNGAPSSNGRGDPNFGIW